MTNNQPFDLPASLQISQPTYKPITGRYGAAVLRTPSGALILGAGIFFLSESPRYAYAKGRTEETRHMIARPAGLDDNDPAANEQIDQIRAKLDEEAGQRKSSWTEIFTRAPHGPPNDSRSRPSGQSAADGRQLLLYYGTTIFRSIGLYDGYVIRIILGSVNGFSTFGGLYVVLSACGFSLASTGRGERWRLHLRLLHPDQPYQSPSFSVIPQHITDICG